MPENRRCMSCMRVVTQEVTFCPSCGEKIDIEQAVPFLPVGTVLSDRYLVGKATSVYADGVTYIGLDTLHNTVVDIREFLPLSIVKRGGADMSIRVKADSQSMYYEYLQSFVMLWRTLMRLHAGLAIATVKDLIVNENLTSYAVTEHLDCVTLKEYIASQGNSGRLTWSRAKALLLPVLPTLEALNSINVIHRAVSPETLVVNSDGRLMVSGFCIPQLCNANSRAEPYIFHGYAPIEQYGYEYAQGSWTDVYSFTAVLYNSLTGLAAPTATDRLEKDQLMIQQDISDTLPSYVLRALFNGLRIIPGDRIQSITLLKLALVPPTAADSAQKPAEQPPKDTSEPEPVSPEGGSEPEPLSQNDEPEKAVNTPRAKRKSSSSVKALFVSALISLIVFAIAFMVLYPTVLYKHIELPQLDDLYSSVVFLPINDEQETTTAEPEETTAEKYVKVADFEKLSYSSVSQNTVFNSKYTLKYDFENNALAKDVIIGQSIAPGSEVLEGTEITLTVSLGPEQVMLPGVIGKSYDEAYNTLTELGFKVKKNIVDNNGGEKEDEVYTMNPVAGIEYDYASEITLNVWGAPSSGETTSDAE